MRLRAGLRCRFERELPTPVEPSVRAKLHGVWLDVVSVHGPRTRACARANLQELLGTARASAPTTSLARQASPSPCVSHGLLSPRSRMQCWACDSTVFFIVRAAMFATLALSLFAPSRGAASAVESKACCTGSSLFYCSLIRCCARIDIVGSLGCYLRC